MTSAEMNPREMSIFSKPCLFKHLVGVAGRKKEKICIKGTTETKKKKSFDKLHSNHLLRKEINVNC